MRLCKHTPVHTHTGSENKTSHVRRAWPAVSFPPKVCLAARDAAAFFECVCAECVCVCRSWLAASGPRRARTGPRRGTMCFAAGPPTATTAHPPTHTRTLMSVSSGPPWSVYCYTRRASDGGISPPRPLAASPGWETTEQEEKK